MDTNVTESNQPKEIKSRPAVRGLFSFDEFDDFFDDFITHRWPSLSNWYLPAGLDRAWPKVDVVDYEDRVEVLAALPGVNKDDLDIFINNQTLTISASRKKEKEERKEDGKYFRREISRGEFQRIISLPDSVNDENVSAAFKEGILTVSIPKTEKKKRKSIEVK